MFGRNLRLPQLKVALLHCYIVTFLIFSHPWFAETPVVEVGSYIITFNVFENGF